MDADTLKLRADTQLRVLATRNNRTKLGLVAIEWFLQRLMFISLDTSCL